MEKYELCGATGEVRIVFLSSSSTASLLKTLSDKNLIMATSFEVKDDFEALITLLNELDQMDVIISSYIEGTHDAKYFCDMVTLAEKFSS